MPVADERRNPLHYLFGKTWHYSEGNRHKVVAFWVMFILSEITNSAAGPLIWAKMIEVLTKEGINAQSMPMLGGCLLLVLARTFVSWAFHGPARCIERSNAFCARNNYLRFLLGGVMALPLDWHNQHHSGETIDKIYKGTGGLFAFAEDTFQPLKSISQLLISAGLLTYVSLRLGGVAFVLIVASAWITIRFDHLLIRQYEELDEIDNKVSKKLNDAITNISTIIVLRVEKLVFDAIIRTAEEPFKLFRENQKLGEIKWFLVSVCSAVMTVLTIFVYFLDHWGAGPGTAVAGFYLITRYLDNISTTFYGFTSIYGTLVRQKARILNAETLSKDFVGESLVNHVLPENWQRLEIKNLTFSYDGEGGKPQLKDISFSVSSGERIALVGETGSGKSTFLRVLRDLFHPTKLSLSVDGELIPHGFEGIKRAITLVPQASEIFTTTIFKNITMGADYTLDFVKKFANMACFTEVVGKLPRGFDSEVNEKGVNLSGGEQQRLALARGLLASHNKDIVLLDEPTSSLDPVTGLAVCTNIFREFRGKTIISTVHQLNLLSFFDRIYVFDKGEIVGSGTIPELLTNCPKFQALWEAMRKAEKGELQVV